MNKILILLKNIKKNINKLNKEQIIKKINQIEKSLNSIKKFTLKDFLITSKNEYFYLRTILPNGEKKFLYNKNKYICTTEDYYNNENYKIDHLLDWFIVKIDVNERDIYLNKFIEDKNIKYTINIS